MTRVAVLTLWLVACTDGAGLAGDPDLATVAVEVDLASRDFTGAACAPTVREAPIPWTDQCMPVAKRAAPTTFASTLDATDPSSLASGLCAHYVSPANAGAILLPSAPAAYPIKLILPSVSAADCACEVVCNGAQNGPTTAFGIALASEGLIGGNSRRAFAIRVAPPWYFVSGGGGEAYPWPCVGGYQEFGVRSCIQIGYGDFGFATHEANAPSVEAIIELVDLPDGGEVGTYCCPFE